MKYFVAFIRDRSGSSLETYGKMFQAKSMVEAKRFAVAEWDRPQDGVFCRPSEVRRATERDIAYYLDKEGV